MSWCAFAGVSPALARRLRQARPTVGSASLPMAASLLRVAASHCSRPRMELDLVLATLRCPASQESVASERRSQLQADRSRRQQPRWALPSLPAA